MRDRTKYKPMKEMTTLDFMNDYYFLEEATRFTRGLKGSKMERSSIRIGIRRQKLKPEAIKRNIKYYMVPNRLSKFWKNYSFFAKNGIDWSIEFVFPNADGLTFQKTFNENLKIHEILKAVLENEKNETISKQLEFYRADQTKLRVLLKAEGVRKCSNRFYELDMRKSLKTNLVNKVIIEFPTVHVLIDHTADDLDVIQSDGEHPTSAASAQIVIFSYSFSRRATRHGNENFQPDDVRGSVQQKNRQ